MNHFAGTARFYAACRPSYPAAVWDLLGREAGLDPSSHVLDLGCGPGTAALALARRVSAVTAVDADGDMLDEGRRAAAAAGVGNVRWVRALAEEFTDRRGRYQLIVIASAFHWMDRPVVARNCHTLLAPGGVLALLGNPTPLLQIRERDSVGAAIAEVQDRWFAEDPFAGQTEELARPEAVLRASPFGSASVAHVPSEQEWDVERLLGFLRSTSSRPDRRLGSRYPAFAAELEDAVRQVEPSGRWKLKRTVEVILARR